MPDRVEAILNHNKVEDREGWKVVGVVDILSTTKDISGWDFDPVLFESRSKEGQGPELEYGEVERGDGGRYAHC